MKEMWVGYNVGCTMGFLMGHSAWQIDQFPTCWPMNGLFVHWSRGWGVSSFSERLVYSTNRVWGENRNDLGHPSVFVVTRSLLCMSITLLRFPHISRQTGLDTDLRLDGHIYNVLWNPAGPINIWFHSTEFAPFPGLWLEEQFPHICRLDWGEIW